MVPWWLALLAVVAAWVGYAALVAGAQADDMRRMADLQQAVEQAFLALLRGDTAEATKTLRQAMARE